MSIIPIIKVIIIYSKNHYVFQEPLNLRWRLV